MVENTKRQKRGLISEEDISTILQRYTATTVLALLQEVAQVPDVKIDWNALVKKTTTGISNAREYQMLWRHLAYRDSLVERLDDGAEPLDDDSDLEYELEACPTVSPDASTEAAACVKVLIASGLPSDSSQPNGSTVEAPLTINIPNGQSTRAPSESAQLSSFMHGTNITVPVSVQKQPLPTVTSAEGLDTNGSASANLPARRKRKPWSAAEDMELIAAVQKCGEGNWANILKGDFKSDRTASQLSQRWAIIRKRRGNLNGGGGSQLSEAQLAARRAVSIALNMPMVDNLKIACSTVGTSSTVVPSNSAHPVAETSSIGVHSQRLSQQDSVATVTQRSGTLGSSSKARVTLKNPSTKSALSADDLVKAAAVAAGARIATPSDAASLLKAAQAKNAVHIMPGGGSLIKSSVAGNANSLPSNVHFIRTGLATTPLSTCPSIPPNALRPVGTQQVQGHTVKPIAPTVQINPCRTSPELNAAPVAANAATSNFANEVETKTYEDIVPPSSVNARKEIVQDDKAGAEGNAKREKVQDQTAYPGNVQQEQVQEGDTAPKEKVQDNQASVSGDAVQEAMQEDRRASVSGDALQEDHQASVSENASKKQVPEDQTGLPSSKIIPGCLFANSKSSSSDAEIAWNDHTVSIGNQATEETKNTNDEIMMDFRDKYGDDNNPVVMDICDNQSVNGIQGDLASMIVDGCDEKVEFLGKEATGTETGEEEKRVVGLEVTV